VPTFPSRDFSNCIFFTKNCLRFHFHSLESNSYLWIIFRLFDNILFRNFSPHLCFLHNKDMYKSFSSYFRRGYLPLPTYLLIPRNFHPALITLNNYSGSCYKNVYKILSNIIVSYLNIKLKVSFYNTK
jgi:hypothetical protein